jgi:Arc/MetJ family transcription regulator/predicted nucleic acid-binding protein
MAKTLVNIDEGLLETARDILRAATKRDTVNGALRDVARRDAATRFLHQACAGIFTTGTHPDRQSNPAGIPTGVEYLVDTSAILHLPHPDVAAVLAPLIQAGTAATCAAIDLALLALITDPAQFTEIRDLRTRSFVFLTTTDDDLRRAVDVRTAWVNGGESHPPDWPELTVAAVAERHQVPVLHYHPVFDHIGKITNQSTVWATRDGDPPPQSSSAAT